MNIENINSFLVVFLIGLLSGLFHVYILKRPLVGKLISALLVGWLGAFIGYFAGSFLPVNFQWLRYISMGTSLLTAQLLLILLSSLSSLNDY